MQLKGITEIGLYTNHVRIVHSAGEKNIPASTRDLDIVGNRIVCFSTSRSELDCSFALADIQPNAIKNYTVTPTTTITNPTNLPALCDVLRPFFFLLRGGKYSLGNFLAFDAVNDRGETSYSPNFQIGTVYTIASWFVITGTQDSAIVGKDNTAQGWFVSVNQTMIRFYRGDFYTHIAHPFALNTLYHLVIVLNATQEKYYVNNTLIPKHRH